MFEANGFYGHRDILLRHCGLPTGTPIPGIVQHGWRIDAGLSPVDLEVPGPKLLWSRRNLDLGRAGGYADLTAIGAPFLYLPEVPAAPPSGQSVLAMPFHGCEQSELQGSLEAYAQALEQLVREGLGPVTVCMYWIEHEQPALRAAFESRGFATTTLGHRDSNPRFLHDQCALLKRHAYVTSNRVSTAAFYGLALGRPFFLCGPPQGLAGTEDPTGEVFDRWQRETFPSLTWERFDGSCREELGYAELGAEYLLSPRELADVLLLGPAHRLARARLAARRWAFRCGRKLRLA